MVEIAQPKLTMDTNGAVEVRHHGLEDKRLLASYFIAPGRVGNGDHCRNLVPDQQIGSHRRNREPGRAHPLVEEGGSDEVLSRDQAIEQKYLAGWPRDCAGPKRILEGPIFLEDRVHDRIGTRRNRIICTGATVQAEQANLRRPHGIGKPRQRFRPESVVEHGLVDQIYHGLKVIFLGHGKNVCKRSGCRFVLTIRLKSRKRALTRKCSTSENVPCKPRMR